VTVRDPASLECRDVVELVTEFLGGTMAPDDRARLEQHLLVCPPCTLHVGQMRSTLERLAELRAAPTSAEVRPAAVDLFRQWKQQRERDEDA
jgi:anti-sigma factor RsiW